MPRNHAPSMFRMSEKVVQLNLSSVPCIAFHCSGSKSYVHHGHQDDTCQTSRDLNTMLHHCSYATTSTRRGDRLIRYPANAANVRDQLHPQYPKYRTHAAPVFQMKQDTTLYQELLVPPMYLGSRSSPNRPERQHAAVGIVHGVCMKGWKHPYFCLDPLGMSTLQKRMVNTDATR